MIQPGERVATAHGPTGYDFGTVLALSHTEGESHWCTVRFDDGSTLLLDWRADGWGRILREDEIR